MCYLGTALCRVAKFFTKFALIIAAPCSLATAIWGVFIAENIKGMPNISFTLAHFNIRTVLTEQLERLGQFENSYRINVFVCLHINFMRFVT